jgi:hypothetical protein
VKVPAEDFGIIAGFGRGAPGTPAGRGRSDEPLRADAGRGGIVP